MPGKLDRRLFLRRAGRAAGLGLAGSLLAACSPAAPAPTTAPARPAEPAKPAAPAGSPAAAASPGPAALAPQAAPALGGPVTKVSYGMASINPYHIVAITGVEKPELTRKFGVEFDLVTAGNSPNIVQAVLGGSLNFGSVTPESSWPAHERTPDLFQVMGCANGTPYTLIVNPDIKTAADLKGKSIGASALRSGADTTAVQILLMENGVQPDDYQILQVGSVAERTAAMKAGTISGCAQLEPQATALRDAGFQEIDNADNYRVLAQVQTLVLISRKGWYEPNMGLAGNFAKAYVDVTKWLYDPKNKEEILALMVRTMKVDEKAATNAYERHIVKSRTPTPSGRVDPTMLAQMAENQKRIGTTGLPADTAKFIDQSIMERAGL